MKKVFIVTIDFNTEKETHEWLDSIQNVNKKDFSLEIVVVDNASKSPFVLETKEKAENVHVIRSEENTGFTGGNNLGMQYALDHNADYVMLINNDTIADKNLIEELLKVLDSDDTIGMTTPKIYFAKGHEFHKDRYKKEDLGKVFWFAGGFTDWKNVASIHRGVDEVDKGQYDKVEQVTFASGCCMLFKASVLKKIGLLDEKHFLYFEDADIDERLQKAGYKIVYVPTAFLWHINAASSGGSGNNLQDYFITRNRMLFGMRYAPLRVKVALIRESLRFLRGGRPMQKKGIKDFYLGKFGKGTYFSS